MALSPAFDTVMHFSSGESNLSQRFGNETLNYYAGNPLNRLSFIRSKSTFLRSALVQANFILFKDLNALYSIDSSHLAFLSYADVQSVLENAYALDEDDLIAAHDSSIDEEGEEPLLLFLGLDEDYVIEKERGENIKKHRDNTNSNKFQFEGYKGRPYFALDVTKPKVYEKLRSSIEPPGNHEGGFQQNVKLVPKEAAILAQARSLIDWNLRHQFCSACGSRTISTHAGTKRVCNNNNTPTTTKPSERPPCISRKGIHNIAFPRTDPTVIMAIVNARGTHVLVGRKPTWPPHFYSTLAGFCEPAESIEDAVRREAWEESGVKVGRVVVHSSQPWPYPNSLMIGCVGEALVGGEDVHLGHDPELDDAKWIPVEGLNERLVKNSMSFRGPVSDGYKEGDMRFPPPTAIAHQLLLAVANGYHLPTSTPTGATNNLRNNLA